MVVISLASVAGAEGSVVEVETEIFELFVFAGPSGSIPGSGIIFCS